MGKHESPPFKMIIEGGRLVPATPYDAERLDTYRRGTKVSVRFTEEKDRVLVRKWWAVLGLVVKQCDVPWQNKEQASEAIKLALGIVNLTKTVGGEFMAYPKSLTELDDPELQEAVEQMTALIQRMTGIDPETLRKETADVGENEHEPSPAAAPAGDAGSGEALSSEPATEEAGEAADGQTAPASEPINPGQRLLMEECIDNMLRDAVSEPAIERPAKVDKMLNIFLAELPDHQEFVQRCHETARRIIGKSGEKARARECLMSKVPT